MNIVITGASNGIGYYTALAASQKPGAKILAVSRNEEKLLQLQQEAKKMNPSSGIHILSLDIADFKAEHFKSELKKNNFNSVDMLINNAGSLINKPFEELSEDDWFNMYKVNIFGPVKIIKTLLPLMGNVNKTHIVNISSYGGFQGSTKFPGLSGYSSCKAALANLTECLAEEFKNKNISVNCLALGSVQTEMFGKAFPGNTASVTPKQMAEFIVDFAFNGHLYFNGKILPVTLSAT